VITKSRSPFDNIYRSAWSAIFIGLGLAAVIFGSYVIGTTGSGMAVIGVAIAFFLGLWIVVQPEVGLYILAAFIYLNLSDILEVRFGIPSINKVMVGLVFISMLANRLILQRKRFVLRSSETPIFIYCFILMFSVLIAGDKSVALNRAVDSVKDLLILLIFVQLCEKEQTWERVQWIIILSAALVGSLSSFQVLTHQYDNDFFGLANAPVHQIVGTFDSVRVTGPISDPNFYAQILLMALPLALYRGLVEQQRSRRLLAIGATIPILLTILFTYSRGGFLALMAVAVVLIFQLKINPYKVIVGAVLVVVIVVPLLPPSYLDRLKTLTGLFPDNADSQTEVSLRGRTSELTIAARMFANNPLFGVGYANFSVNYADYNLELGVDTRAGAREAHDLYLEILAETGIIGFAAFLAVIITVFAGLRRARHLFLAINRPDLGSRVVAIQSSLIAFLVTSLFLHGAYIRYFWLIISVAMGATVLAAAMTQQSSQSDEELSSHLIQSNG
jgi:O-antigen ligase